MPEGHKELLRVGAVVPEALKILAFEVPAGQRELTDLLQHL